MKADKELREQIASIFTDEGERFEAKLDQIQSIIDTRVREAVIKELEILKKMAVETTHPQAFMSNEGVAQSIRVRTNSLIEHRLAELTKEGVQNG